MAIVDEVEAELQTLEIWQNLQDQAYKMWLEEGKKFFFSTKKMITWLCFAQAVHDAEDKLVKSQLELDKVREKLQLARLELREQISDSASSYLV